MRLSIKELTRLSFTLALFLIGDFGDYIESLEVVTSRPILHAFVDNLIHTIIGILTWSVISDDPWTISFELVSVTLLSSVIDLDHFIAARSLTIHGALHAPRRGIFHCSGLLLAITVLFVLCQKPQWALITFVSFVPHHLRDATRRGIYLYLPYVHSSPISKTLVRFLIPAFPWTVIFTRWYFNMQKSYEDILMDV